MTYFKKSLVFNPIHVDGKKVEWERVGRHDGVLATTDPKVTAVLAKIAQEHRLGVSVITESEYEDLKKNPYVAPSQQWSPLMGDQWRLPQQNPSAPVAASDTDPAPKPAPSRRPRVAKPSTIKGALAQQT